MKMLEVDKLFCFLLCVLVWVKKDLVWWNEDIFFDREESLECFFDEE